MSCWRGPMAPYRLPSDVDQGHQAEESVPELVEWCGNGLAKVRQGLVKTHLFSSSQGNAVLDTAADPSTADGIKIAVVWGAVGILLALQMDWILGQVLNPPANPALAEPITETITDETASADNPSNSFERALSELSWPAEENDQDENFAATDDDGFVADQGVDDTGLVTSPAQPMVAVDALVEESTFPTFNSQQLNEKTGPLPAAPGRVGTSRHYDCGQFSRPTGGRSCGSAYRTGGNGLRKC